MTGVEEPSDTELAARARGGDPEAMAALVDRHEGALRAYATRWMPPLVRRKISVADMIQETRIAAVQRGADFEDRGTGSLRNWLIKILENKVKHVLRSFAGTAKRDVRREITQGGEAPRPEAAHDDATPSEVAIASDLADLVEEVLAELPPHHAQVLRLARLEGRSLREVAELMGRSREAVKKSYARALSSFTEAFDRKREARDA